MGKEVDEVNWDVLENAGLKPMTGEFWAFHCANSFWHGKVKVFNSTVIVLEQATWVPATGRFSHFMKDPDGTTKEAEMMPNDHYIMVHGLVDFGKPVAQKPVSTKERE